MTSYIIKRNLTKFFVYVFLAILFVICIGPVWVLLVNATRSTAEINASFSLLPGGALLDNWDHLTRTGVDFGAGLRNSMVVSVSTTFLSVYFSMLTAYALNVYNIKFKKAFFAFILSMVLVPGQLFLIGFFQHMNSIGLLNTLWPLIIPSIAAPGTVFFMNQYLKGAIVHELIEAARIDGCHEFGIFNRIALPLAAPGAFTFGIFAFVGSWNSFITPLFIIGANQPLHTMPLLMSRVQAGGMIPELGPIYLGMVITLAPILIVYAIFSKYIVQGISLGSIKE